MLYSNDKRYENRTKATAVLFSLFFCCFFFVVVFFFGGGGGVSCCFSLSRLQKAVCKHYEAITYLLYKFNMNCKNITTQ